MEIIEHSDGSKFEDVILMTVGVESYHFIGFISVLFAKYLFLPFSYLLNFNNADYTEFDMTNS